MPRGSSQATLQRAPWLAVSDDRRGNLGQWEKRVLLGSHTRSEYLAQGLGKALALYLVRRFTT